MTAEFDSPTASSTSSSGPPVSSSSVHTAATAPGESTEPVSTRVSARPARILAQSAGPSFTGIDGKRYLIREISSLHLDEEAEASGVEDPISLRLPQLEMEDTDAFLSGVSLKFAKCLAFPLQDSETPFVPRSIKYIFDIVHAVFQQNKKEAYKFLRGDQDSRRFIANQIKVLSEGRIFLKRDEHEALKTKQAQMRLAALDPASTSRSVRLQKNNPPPRPLSTQLMRRPTSLMATTDKHIAKGSSFQQPTLPLIDLTMSSLQFEPSIAQSGSSVAPSQPSRSLSKAGPHSSRTVSRTASDSLRSLADRGTIRERPLARPPSNQRLRYENALARASAEERTQQRVVRVELESSTSDAEEEPE